MAVQIFKTWFSVTSRRRKNQQQTKKTPKICSNWKTFARKVFCHQTDVRTNIAFIARREREKERETAHERESGRERDTERQRVSEERGGEGD